MEEHVNNVLTLCINKVYLPTYLQQREVPWALTLTELVPRAVVVNFRPQNLTFWR